MDPPTMAWLIQFLDLLGVAVFAASGALVASRKELDLVGFALVATVTGIGGGTLRDLLLDRPIVWLHDASYLSVCIGVATLLFFVAPHLQRRFVYLLWADALGLALFAILGADIALNAGVSPLSAIVMGVMTATFGGLIRDVLCNEIPLILRKEIYATAAALGAVVFVTLRGTAADGVAELSGIAACFALRGLALRFGWSLPAYRQRPGRDYPLD